MAKKKVEVKTDEQKVNSGLLDKIMKAGTTKYSTVLAESELFNERDVISTDIPIINTAFTGSVDGGFTAGLTMIAGNPATYKSLLSLYCMGAYFKAYPDAIAIFYENEFGVTKEYLKMHGIDARRIIHVPMSNVEDTRFDIMKRLGEIERGDHVFIMMDSLGALVSKRLVQNTEKEKDAKDMSRPAAIKEFLCLVIPALVLKNIPMFIINHIYDDMNSTDHSVIIPGGKAVSFLPNQIFVIGKAQDKDSEGNLLGYKFTINIKKGRYVKEKSKLPFVVSFDGGIEKYSGLLDLALESGDVTKPSNGWYSLVDTETGEVSDKKVREDATQTEEFLGVVLKREKFKKFVEDTYKLKSPEPVTDEQIAEGYDNANED